MATGTITRFPEGAGAEQYDAVIKELDPANNPPEGLIFHSAAELDGQFQVFNVWESPDQFDRFVEERLRPAQVKVLGEERVQAMAAADVVRIEIHNYVVP